MISEAPPEDPADYFYSRGAPLYLQTTLKAFNDAGVPVGSMGDILALGIYITTAVKCAKTRYAVSADTIKNCSLLLERELALFPDARVFLLMGDTAIKAVNYISRRDTGKPVIPVESTYKIRTQQFYFDGRRVFPSYLQTGQNYLIERSKREMVAEDIRAAMKIIRSA
jgi:uracil-DNA glycosylase